MAVRLSLVVVTEPTCRSDATSRATVAHKRAREASKTLGAVATRAPGSGKGQT